MARVKKKSVAPIYLVGVVWLVYALIFPLYRLPHFLICGVLSAVAYAVGRAIWPDAVIITEDREPEKPKQEERPKQEEKKKSAEKKTGTGNPDLDRLTEERDMAVAEMHRLNDAIEDEKISAQIDHLEESTKKIVAQVIADPKKLPKIRQFMNYYLPTTLKILNAYDRMDSTGISGENIDNTKKRVEDMLDTLVQAYDKQLDNLFGEEALDISTDIRVLEQMLAREGITGSSIYDTRTQEQQQEEKKSEDSGIRLEL